MDLASAKRFSIGISEARTQIISPSRCNTAFRSVLGKGIEVYLFDRVEKFSGICRGIFFRAEKSVAKKGAAPALIDGYEDVATLNVSNQTGHGAQLHGREIIAHRMKVTAHRAGQLFYELIWVLRALHGKFATGEESVGFREPPKRWARSSV